MKYRAASESLPRSFFQSGHVSLCKRGEKHLAMLVRRKGATLAQLLTRLISPSPGPGQKREAAVAVSVSPLQDGERRREANPYNPTTDASHLCLPAATAISVSLFPRPILHLPPHCVCGGIFLGSLLRCGVKLSLDCQTAKSVILYVIENT